MPKNLKTWINELKTELKGCGYSKDIPINLFKAQFMIISGYSTVSVNRWVDNFVKCDLIRIEGDIVNFV